MTSECPSLGRADFVEIVDHLDHALAVFKQAPGTPARPLDVYFRSVLSTLRRELVEHPAPLCGDQPTTG
jgi:hypothetical protein